jgi:thiol-disulfide isomerase/thioredoxin
MTVLSVAVAVLAVLVLLDLVLTLGVVRRLRDHSTRIGVLQGIQPEEASLPDAGAEIAPFTVVTASGTLTNDDLAEPTLVGFFTPDCPSCEEKLPTFLSYAHEFPGGKARVIGVVASESGGVSYRNALSEVATVATERERGDMQKAFGVQAFPTFLVIVDGQIVQATHHVTDLPVHQPA